MITLEFYGATFKGPVYCQLDQIAIKTSLDSVPWKFEIIQANLGQSTVESFQYWSPTRPGMNMSELSLHFQVLATHKQFETRFSSDPPWS